MRIRALTTAALLAVFALSTPLTTPLSTPALASDTGQESGQEHGRYIVTLTSAAVTAEGTADVTARRLLARYQGSILASYRHAISGFAAAMSPEQARRLAADPAVAAVEVDQIVRTQDFTPGSRRDFTPGSPQDFPQDSEPQPSSIYGDSWNVGRIDQRWWDNTVTYSFNPAYMGAGVTAYIIDTGIRGSHPEFGGRVISGPDYVDNDANSDDCDGHGTGVAGIVGGEDNTANNLFGHAGVAHDVSLVAIRVLGCAGTGYLSDVVKAIDWTIEDHAAGEKAVINLSNQPEGGQSPALNAAAQRAIADGISFVAAAGNSNVDACNYSPNTVPGVITVGASARYDFRASFSNWGQCIDVFAPGHEVETLDMNDFIWWKTVSGTSFAAPHVTGVVARYLQTHGSESNPLTVEAAIVNNATGGIVENSMSPHRKLLHASRGSQPLATCQTHRSNGTRLVVPMHNVWAESVINISGCGTDAFQGRLRVHWAQSGPHLPSGQHLRIELRSPVGQTFVLDAGGPGSTTELFADIDVVSTRNGNWTLRVKAVFPVYYAEISNWSLVF